MMLKAKEYCVQSSNVLKAKGHQARVQGIVTKGIPSISVRGVKSWSVDLSQVLLELLWKKKKTFYIGVSLQECVIREQEEIFYADKSFCRRVVNWNISRGS